MSVTDIKAFDSSALLYYLFGQSEECRKIVDSEADIVISTVSIFEVKRKLLRLGTDSRKIESALSLIKKRTIIEELSINLAEAAADIAQKHSLHATDSIIYATARKHDADLVTADKDFKGVPGVEIID